MVWPCDMRDDEEEVRAAAAVLWGKVKLHPSGLCSPASPLAAPRRARHIAGTRL